MANNFCTLFDRNYLYKGLAMYYSLIANCTEEFNLWILCMDQLTYELLQKMNLPRVTLVSLIEFESKELLKVKSERNVAEYSWTCASNFIWFLLKKNKELESAIYLDADLYFFNDPKILIEELENKDVMITGHRYTKKFDKSGTSGKYCVQFMIFKNNTNGLIVLDWWRQACLDWCFSYFDNGRLGDQKYLDDWLTRFSGVYELQNLGGGVAPWNVQQYSFLNESSKTLGRELSSNKKFPLVFFHFHGYCLISKNKYLGSVGYPLSRNAKRFIYKPYFKGLQNSILMVKKTNTDFNFGFKRVALKDRLYARMMNNSFFEKIYLRLKKI